MPRSTSNTSLAVRIREKVQSSYITSPRDDEAYEPRPVAQIEASHPSMVLHESTTHGAATTNDKAEGQWESWRRGHCPRKKGGPCQGPRRMTPSRMRPRSYTRVNSAKWEP